MATRKKPAAKKPAAKKPAAKKPAAKKPAAKKPAGTALAKPRGDQQVMSMADVRAMMKGDRKAIAKGPKPGGSRLSFRAGNMSYMGVPLGESVDIIILRSGYLRKYFENSYDPSNMSPPDCFSFDGDTPHENSGDPQSGGCEGCQWDEYETAEQGRGKACKENTSLAFLMIPKGITIDKAESLPIVTCTFSVMNAKTINARLSAIYEQTDEQPWACTVTLTCEPDDKNQYATDLVEPVLINDADIVAALMQRAFAAGEAITKPWPKPDGDAPAKHNRRSKRRTTRR